MANGFERSDHRNRHILFGMDLPQPQAEIDSGPATMVSLSVIDHNRGKTGCRANSGEGVQ
jgi:hypothetical protein